MLEIDFDDRQLLHLSRREAGTTGIVSATPKSSPVIFPNRSPATSSNGCGSDARRSPSFRRRRSGGNPSEVARAFTYFDCTDYKDTEPPKRDAHREAPQLQAQRSERAHSRV